MLIFNIPLFYDKYKFKKEFSLRNENKIIIDINDFREKINEKIPSASDLKYAEIVDKFRPESKYGKIIDVLLVVVFIIFLIYMMYK